MEALYLTKFGKASEAFERRDLVLSSLGSNEVRIKVDNFGLNFADIMARKGLYPDCPPLPAVIGYEVLGRIESKGDEVLDFEIGDRVIAMTRFGGYASHVHTPAMAAVKIAEEMPTGEALALVTQGITAYYMAEEQLRLRMGDKVLIHAAAGGVGSLLVQLCKNKGCEVFGTASSSKHQFIKELGVDHPIDYRKKDYFRDIQAILGDAKLDVIFDPVGGKGFKEGMKLLGPVGNIICFGGSTFTQVNGLVPKILRFLSFGFYHPMGLMRNSQSLLTANMLRVGDHKPQYLNDILTNAVASYQKGSLRPHANTHFPVSKLSEAHDFLESRKSLGKITIDWE